MVWFGFWLGFLVGWLVFGLLGFFFFEGVLRTKNWKKKNLLCIVSVLAVLGTEELEQANVKLTLLIEIGYEPSLLRSKMWKIASVSYLISSLVYPRGTHEVWKHYFHGLSPVALFHFIFSSMSDVESGPALNLLLFSINKLRDLNHFMILPASIICGKQHSSSSELAISLASVSCG